MAAARILLLVGSPTSDFHRDLSLVYARGCVDALGADTARYAFLFASLAPDGSWRFPSSLDRADLEAAPAVPIDRALAILASLRIDVALPQMFCLAGMTDYRALLDVLKIPYLGNRPVQMAIAADKAKAKALVAGAGVATPRAELLGRGEVPTLPLPVVVKPNDADNSDGIALVMDAAALPAALDAAFAYSPTVLVETFVELGREVRCGLVVEGDALVCLPLEEYCVDARTRPVRTRADKLRRDAADDLTLVAKQASESWIVAADDPIVDAVWDAARRCHQALGCTQYSLFDFRIDPAGRPWFLEASLYCSFSPHSVLVTMMKARGTTLDTFFADAVARARSPARPAPVP